jgi:hypothetical protein
MKNLSLIKHKNPDAGPFSRVAVVRFKTGQRWIVCNLFGFTLIYKV